ncbi:hypothetical protein glysoja_005071 [Glycine soja]|nr:hypothetical protein glysoja_005071 [Glycine soja]
MGELYAMESSAIAAEKALSLLSRLAAKVRWPGLFDGVDSATEDWIIDQMHTVAEGLTVEGILENWSKLKPIIMEEWDEKRDDLIDLFGKVRDEWLEQDFATWIGANSHFADALLQELAGVAIPPERIFGLGTGPKVEVLKQLQKKPEHQGLTLHFVEDRLATLKNVIQEPELDQWNLYLGNWGYNTRKEREGAAAIPRIHVLGLSDFSKKLK